MKLINICLLLSIAFNVAAVDDIPDSASSNTPLTTKTTITPALTPSTSNVISDASNSTDSNLKFTPKPKPENVSGETNQTDDVLPPSVNNDTVTLNETVTDAPDNNTVNLNKTVTDAPDTQANVSMNTSSQTPSTTLKPENVSGETNQTDDVIDNNTVNLNETVTDAPDTQANVSMNTSTPKPSPTHTASTTRLVAATTVKESKEMEKNEIKMGTNKGLALGITIPVLIVLGILAGVYIYKKKRGTGRGYETLDEDFGSFEGLQRRSHDVDL
jgi:hypothetical protein